jgi:type I restriction enzyme S subunit
VKTATWTTALLREVTTKIGTGATPRGGSDSYKATGVPLIRSLNVYDDGFREEGLAYLDDEQASRLDHVIVQEGDVLLNITGASVARCCVAPAQYLPARVNQHVSIIRPRPDVLCHRFLRYLLIAGDYKKRLLDTGEGGGTTRQAITKAQLQDFRIAFPPVPEQRRIVAILDEAFEGIAAAKANADVCSHKCKELAESSLLEQLLAKRWIWKTVGDVAERFEYGSAAKSKREGKVPVVRMGNIQNGEIDWEDLVYSSDDAEIERFLLRPDDVLFNRTNSPELVGKTALFDGTRPALFAGYLIRIHRRESMIEAAYLAAYLNSRIAREHGKTVLAGSVNQANISGSRLKAYPIPLPPLSEQKAITAKWKAIRAEAQAYQRLQSGRSQALDELKASLLRQAFTGAL